MVGGRGPLLPDPGVGLGPGGGDVVGEAGDGPPGLAVEAVAGVGEEPGGVEHPAVAVELVLAGGAVADPHGAAVGVAGPAVELGFGWSGPTVEGEQHREAGSGQAAGVEQPGEEGAGLLRLAGGEEGGDPDGGVAGPGVAVVPVAAAADPLGQRGGRGGDRGARRRVGEQLQRHAGCAPRRRDGRSTSMPAAQARQPASSRASSAAATAGGHDDQRAAAGGGERRSSPVAPGRTSKSTGRSASTAGPSEVTAMARSPRSHTSAPARRSMRRAVGGRSRSGGRGGAGRARRVRGR